MVEIEIMRVDVCALHLLSLDVEARHFWDGEDGGREGRREGERSGKEGMIWSGIGGDIYGIRC